MAAFGGVTQRARRRGEAVTHGGDKQGRHVGRAAVPWVGSFGEAASAARVRREEANKPRRAGFVSLCAQSAFLPPGLRTWPALGGWSSYL